MQALEAGARDTPIVNDGVLQAPPGSYLQCVELYGEREDIDAPQATNAPVDLTVGWEWEHALHAFSDANKRQPLRCVATH